MKRTLTLEFDDGELFDMVAKAGDGGHALAQRIAASMFGGGPGFFDAVGMAFYGVNIKQPYQDRVGKWMLDCFGADITNSLDERCYRFFEEAGELCQALGMTEEMAQQLVTYTWGREKGEPSQEVGGVMVTLAALCYAASLDIAQDGETELSRISAPEIMDKIRRKHAAKVLRTPHSALPGDVEQ